jgi:hypothetical protein
MELLNGAVVGNGTQDTYGFSGNSLLIPALNLKVTCLVNVFPSPIRSVITVESIDGDAERVEYNVSDAVNAPESFMRLLDYNYSLTVQQIYSISRYINDVLLPSNTKEFVSHGIGFLKGTRHLVYGDTIFYSNGNVKPVFYLPEFNAPKVMRRGSADAYIEQVREHIIGRVGLEFMLAFGLSGIVGSLLTVGDIGRPILSIYGQSSLGKSTAAKLAESVSYRRTVKTLNMSMAAFRKIINYYGVVPIEYEDFNANMNFAKKDIASFILELFSTEQEDALCYAPIIITSVKSVSETTGRTGNVGQLARILEINCMEDVLTESGIHSRAIKNFTEEAYGHIGYMVLGYIYSNNLINSMNDRYLRYLSKVEADVGYGSAERLCNQLALYMVGVEIFNEVFDNYNLRLSVDGIYAFILRHALSQFNREKHKVDFDKNNIMRQLSDNKHKFVNGIPSDENPLDMDYHYGYITESHIFLRSTLLNDKGNTLFIQIAQNKNELISAGVIETPNSRGRDSRVTVKVGVKALSGGDISYRQVHFYQIKRA